MTVVSSSNNITFAGDGVQILFDFNFKIFREEDLAAVVRDSLGFEKQLVTGTDFKLISGPEIESGGRVSYPLSGNPLQVGESITLFRDIAYSQELELVDNDPFSAGLLNEAFDRGVMRDQQLQEQIARSLKYDISTPTEEQLMPQEFMNTVINSRDAANIAVSGAETAKADAQVAQSAAEVAKAGAEAAQIAAEYAKDQAEEIALGELTSLRSDTPVLAGVATATEGETVEISITDYVEDSLTNYEIDVVGFGSAQLVGGLINWTLGPVAIDTPYSVNVIRRKRGELYSETAVHQVLVKNVQVNDGPTVVFSNDSVGWPGATIDDDGIHSPANSVGAINTKQIVSGEMEIEVAGSEFPVLGGTTGELLKTSVKPTKDAKYVANNGSGYFGDVTEVMSDSDIILHEEPYEYSGMSAGWVDKTAPLPVGVTITHLGFNSTSATSAGRMHIVRKDSATLYTCVAEYLSILAHTGDGTFQYAILSVPFTVPDDGNEYYLHVSAVPANCAYKIVESGLALYGGDVDLIIGSQYTFSNTTTCPMLAYSVDKAVVESYEAAIALPEAPTKIFADPTQGEIIKVDEASTSTSFVSSDEIIEGQEFDSNLGGFKAVALSTSVGGTELIKNDVPTLVDHGTFTFGVMDKRTKLTGTVNKIGIVEAAHSGINYMAVAKDNTDGTFDIIEQVAYSTDTVVDGFYMHTLVTSIDTTDGDYYIAGIGPVSAKTVSGVAGTGTYYNGTIVDSLWTPVITADNGYALVVAYEGDGTLYTADITAAGFAEAPSNVSRKADNVFAIGAGNTGEYIGKPIELALAGGGEVDGAEGTIHTTTVTYPEKAFDGDPATYAYDGGTPEWPFILGKLWDSARVVSSVHVASITTGWSNIVGTPASVEIYLEGSNDGMSWDILGSTGAIVNVESADVNVVSASAIAYTNHRIRLEDLIGTGNGAVNSMVSLIEFTEVSNTTAQVLVFTSVESITDKLHTDGGFHNNLDCTMLDGSIETAIIESVSEELVDGKFKTNATLSEALADVPVSVTIPDRCTYTPTDVTASLSGEALKIKSDKVQLPDNAELKQIAMAVRATDDMCFTDGKIYIQETM